MPRTARTHREEMEMYRLIGAGVLTLVILTTWICVMSSKSADDNFKKLLCGFAGMAFGYWIK
jgi:hypothetical protein